MLVGAASQAPSFDISEIKLKQTYGLSRTGTLRSHSNSSDSLWIKVGARAFETRIVYGLLDQSEIGHARVSKRPESLYRGRLARNGRCNRNRRRVHQDSWAKSELINVGGQKVYPAEIESTFATHAKIEDAAFHGELHSIMNTIVFARVKLSNGKTIAEFQFSRSHFALWRAPDIVKGRA